MRKITIRYTGSVLALALLVFSGCGRDEPIIDSAGQASRVSAEEAITLLLDTRLPSRERGRVAIILAARFKVASLPWLQRALDEYPLSRWPDRAMIAKALRGMRAPQACAMLLQCARDRVDHGLRLEAITGLGFYRQDPAVMLRLRSLADKDPNQAIRKKATQIIGQ